VRDRSVEAQLAGFIDKYTPDIGDRARRARAKLRALLPGAVEMIYDNYNALVIGFGPTDRASDAILSIALYPKWVNLFFLNGANLPDPKKRLKGSGTRVRRILLDDASVLDEPEVRTLIAVAIERAPKPFDRKSSPRTIIKSISPKQRPRRAS
jgi:hypothetical protein